MSECFSLDKNGADSNEDAYPLYDMADSGENVEKDMLNRMEQEKL